MTKHHYTSAEIKLFINYGESWIDGKTSTQIKDEILWQAAEYAERENVISNEQVDAAWDAYGAAGRDPNNSQWDALKAALIAAGTISSSVSSYRIANALIDAGWIKGLDKSSVEYAELCMFLINILHVSVSGGHDLQAALGVGK